MSQYQPGEHNSEDGKVPLIGWDLGSTSAPGDIDTYIFDRNLLADTYISITLVWDRKVVLANDSGTVGQYDHGTTDELIASPLVNMNLALRKSDGTGVAWSTSPNDSVEHIFYQIQESGPYKFDVEQVTHPYAANHSFGVAWWAVPEPNTFALLAFGAVVAVAYRRRSLQL